MMVIICFRYRKPHYIGRGKHLLCLFKSQISKWKARARKCLAYGTALTLPDDVLERMPSSEAKEESHTSFLSLDESYSLK